MSRCSDNDVPPLVESFDMLNTRPIIFLFDLFLSSLNQSLKGSLYKNKFRKMIERATMTMKNISLSLSISISVSLARGVKEKRHFS